MAIGEGVLSKLFPSGDRHNLAVSLQFRRKRHLSQSCDCIVDAALIVQFRIYFLVAFANQARLDHSAERAVERSRSHLHFSLRLRLYLLHDSIAVPLPGGEGEEDMKHRWSQRWVGHVRGHVPKLYP